MNYCRFTITVRDILLWVEFMNKTSPPLSPSCAFLNGAEMIFIDSLGCVSSCNYSFKEECLNVLRNFCKLENEEMKKEMEEEMEEDRDGEDVFGINPFYIERGMLMCSNHVV